MRIISGFYKGRELKSPNSAQTHPMGDRERLALFNMLGDVSGLTVLDLYAGTGALGIEALSRGAASAVFVERDHSACTLIKANLETLNGEVVCSNVEHFRPKKLYDLVFIDPPYNLYDKNLVKKLANFGKRAVISLPKDGELPDLSILKDRSYAKCRLLITSIDPHELLHY